MFKTKINTYVFNLDEHQNSINSINKIIIELENYEGSFTSTKKEMENQSGDMIFISHSEKDKNIVDLLANEIQKFGRNVFYTSIPPMNILETGKDFIKGLLSEIIGSEQIIACLSPNFYESIICQIEMGMAYALGKKITPLIISLNQDFSNNLRGVFNSNTKADHIYSEDQLISLLEKINPVATAGMITQSAKNIVKGLPEVAPEITSNFSENEFNNWYKDGIVSEEQLVFFKYITETITFNYYWGWQENLGIENFSQWLRENEYQDNFAHLMYHKIIQLMVNYEILEPYKLTANQNVKEYKMKKEFIKNAYSFYKGTQS